MMMTSVSNSTKTLPSNIKKLIIYQTMYLFQIRRPGFFFCFVFVCFFLHLSALLAMLNQVYKLFPNPASALIFVILFNHLRKAKESQVKN